ncbi:MAG: SCP2 sterol-binding domain-containing protein [Methylophilaceae bacterium]
MMVKTKMIDGVNHILHQNDWTKPHLVNFAGKVIELNYGNDLFVQLMQINNDGSLSLVKFAESQPSLTIKVSNRTVFQMITKQDLDDIEIQGDMKLAKKLSEVLKNLEWDLSLEIDRYLGPQAAGIYQRLSNKIITRIRDITKNIMETTVEYYQEENKIFAKPYQVKEFNDDVDELLIRFENLQRKYNEIFK